MAVLGHVHSGKSTMLGRLLYELGGMSERDLARLKREAHQRDKESHLFAFFLDRCINERTQGHSIMWKTREFFTDQFHYTVVDTPGDRYVYRMYTYTYTYTQVRIRACIR